MTREGLPLLVLVPPLPCAHGSSASLQELAVEVRACRARGLDVRLRVCRGRTARGEAEAASTLGLQVLVVALPEHAAEEGLGLSCPRRALEAALCEAGVELACAPLADAVRSARPHCGDADGGVDLPAPAPLAPRERLHDVAHALLASHHADPNAEVFAGNALAARNPELLENILPWPR